MLGKPTLLDLFARHMVNGAGVVLILPTHVVNGAVTCGNCLVQRHT